MFDLNKVKTRYFQVKIGEMTLNLEPAGIKTIKKMASLSNESSMDDVIECVKLILNKNKEHRDVSNLIEEFTVDQLNAIVEKYFEWIGNVKNSKN